MAQDSFSGNWSRSTQGTILMAIIRRIGSLSSQTLHYLERKGESDNAKECSRYNCTDSDVAFQVLRLLKGSKHFGAS